MDKINRSHRIHQLQQSISESFQPRVGIYFGEHVIRVDGQLCLVVTLDGEVGLRASEPELEAELVRACGDRHWIAHGRSYDQWYLLPDAFELDDPVVVDWVQRAASGARALARREKTRLKA